MSLSRWGDRVEKAMQPRELTASELISQEAERVEIEQITGFILEWISKRMKTVYRGSKTTVEYDMPMDIYKVVLRYAHEGIDFQVTFPIRAEDVASASQTTYKWSSFMDSQVLKLTTVMRKRLMDAGVDDPWFGQKKTDQVVNGINDLGSALRTFGRSANEVATTLSRLHVDELRDEWEKEQEKEDEQAAIESIRRTIAAQQPDEA